MNIPADHTSRRTFLAASAAFAGALAAGAGLAASARADTNRWIAPSRAKKKILILGGTGFLGPHVVDAAQARGHTVTLFNRGKTEKRKGGMFPEIEKLQGDRDPKVGEGLKALEGKKWDAVVDTSGYVPRIVKASAELLAPNVNQYVFISTLSVYAKNDKAGLNESDPVGTMEDPTNEEVNKYYGQLKALCEQAAEAAFPGRTLNIRPGYIVGPGDSTDRFTYWPMRAKRGGEILAPGTPNDPLQVIDARDLAEWIVLCIENGTMGVFNACGPVGGMKWGDCLAACQKAAKTPSTLTWVPAEFLEQHGAGPGRLPIWIPPVGEYTGFHQRDISKAVKAGLKSRPIEQICADIIAWYPTEIERRVRATKDIMDEAEKAGKAPPKMADPRTPRAGISPEKEAEILAAWHARGKEAPAAKPDAKPAEKPNT